MGRGSRGVSLHEQCWALECRRKDRALRGEVRYFRFPSDPARCRDWVIRSGNVELAVDTLTTLPRKSLCSSHFERDQFKVPGNIHSGLIPRCARPTIFSCPPLPDNVLPPVLGYSTPLPSLPKPPKERAHAFTAPPVRPLAKLPSVSSSKSPKRASPKRSSPAAPVNCDIENVFPACYNLGSSPPPLRPILQPRKGNSPRSLKLASPSRSPAAEKRRPLASIGNVDESKKRRLDFTVNLGVTATSTPLPQPVNRPPPLIFKSPVWSSPSLRNVGANEAVENSARPLVSPASPSRNVHSVVSSSSSVSNPSTTSVECSQSLNSNHNTRPSRMSAKRLFNVSKARAQAIPELSETMKSAMLIRRKYIRARNTLEAVRGHNKALLKAANSPSVGQLSKVMKTKEAAILFGAQFRNAGRRKRGVRWTLEEKTVALALWRGAKKNYRVLRSMLNLPGQSTLFKFMTCLHFDVGENKKYFEHLRSVVSKMRKRDRACVVMWDETQIKRHYSYNEQKDKVVGGVDFGDGTDVRGVANKGLVFMVQSLSKKWKQPVAYYFGEDEVPASILVKLIYSVICHLQDAGFDVRATVCDQGGNNRSAVSALQKKFQPSRPSRIPLCDSCKARRKSCLASKSHFTKSDCKECRINAIRPAVNPFCRINNATNIWHFWDPPHLIKNLRNNFLAHDIDLGDGRIAKWDHLLQLRSQDGCDGTFYHIALKLSDDHLNFAGKKRGNKMKVKFAVQVFSCRVATALKKIHDWSDGKAIPGSLPTAEFLLEGDRLFDSFNGGCKSFTGKKLRVNLSENSPHFEFWDEMEEKIKQWHFIGSERTMAFHVGWLENIAAYRGLWHDLSTHPDPLFRFQYLNLRRLNQDPLENLFSAIKLGGKTPTAEQFIGGLKTAIITNLRGSGTDRGNCAEDGGTLLTDLHVFFQSATGQEEPEDVQEYDTERAEYERLNRAPPVVASRSSAGTAIDSETSSPLAVSESVVVTVNDEATAEEHDGVLEDLFSPCHDEEDDEDRMVIVTDDEVEQEEVDQCALSDEEMDVDPVEVCAPLVAFGDSGPGVSVDPAVEEGCTIWLDSAPEAITRARKKDPFNPKNRTESDRAQDAELEGRMAVRREHRQPIAERRKKVAYVCGFMVKKVKKFVKCADCISTLLTDEPDGDHDLVIAFEVDDKRRLTYAHRNVIDITVASLDVFLLMIRSHLHRTGLKKAILSEIENTVDLSSLGCCEEGHAAEVSRVLLLYFFRVSLYHYLRLSNKKLEEENRLKAQSITNLVDRQSARRKETQGRGCNRRQVQTAAVREQMVDDPAPISSGSLGDFVSPELLQLLDLVEAPSS